MLQKKMKISQVTLSKYSKEQCQQSLQNVFDPRTFVPWSILQNYVLQNAHWELSPYRLKMQLRHFLEMSVILGSQRVILFKEWVMDAIGIL